MVDGHSGTRKKLANLFQRVNESGRSVEGYRTMGRNFPIRFFSNAFTKPGWSGGLRQCARSGMGAVYGRSLARPSTPKRSIQFADRNFAEFVLQAGRPVCRMRLHNSAVGILQHGILIP